MSLVLWRQDTAAYSNVREVESTNLGVLVLIWYFFTMVFKIHILDPRRETRRRNTGCLLSLSEERLSTHLLVTQH